MAPVAPNNKQQWGSTEASDIDKETRKWMSLTRHLQRTPDDRMQRDKIAFNSQSNPLSSALRIRTEQT